MNLGREWTAEEVNAWALKQNAIHIEFWKRKMPDIERKLQDPILFDEAVRRNEKYCAMQVPARYQCSLEYNVEDAADFRKRILADQASKGGKAPKGDALQGRIESLVARNPYITAKALLNQLHTECPGDLIEEIVDGDIAFKENDGTSKKASITGLKDRLSRAKKKMKSFDKV